jgi:hypothetical protein
MQQKYMWLLAGVAIGVIAGNKLRTLPGVGSLPSV